MLVASGKILSGIKLENGMPVFLDVIFQKRCTLLRIPMIQVFWEVIAVSVVYWFPGFQWHYPLTQQCCIIQENLNFQLLCCGNLVTLCYVGGVWDSMVILSDLCKYEYFTAKCWFSVTVYLLQFVSVSQGNFSSQSSKWGWHCMGDTIQEFDCTYSWKLANFDCLQLF